jgi:hypothetical protein
MARFWKGGSGMLQRLTQLRGFTASATDGDIGQVEDFLFDDERWTIRYLVVEMGGFLERRQVLVSPISFERADWAAQRFRLKLTKEQVLSSPSIDADKPVSRQHETEFSRYYGYPYYWGSSGVWGAGFFPGMLLPPPQVDPVSGPSPTDERKLLDEDVHLRSAHHVRGYHIQARDDAIGHVEDFIIDDASWQIRYVIVDTRNWWFGKKVLLAPDLIDHVSWAESRVFANVTQHAIKSGPAWGPADRLDDDYEARLREHYARAS